MVGVIAVEKIVAGEKKYLYCAELLEGASGEKYVYLLRIKRRVDVNGNPYLTFYMKTADKVTLIGHKFRVEENDSLGVDILSLNRMVVNIKFDVQIYRGAFSLLIKCIESLPREDASMFFDSYIGVNDTFERLAKIAVNVGARPLNFAFKTASIFSVRHGASGAYVELLDMVNTIITARKTEHSSKMIKCLMSLSNQYFSYLIMLEKIEFIPKKEILSLLHSSVVDDDSNLSSVVIDTLSALMGQSNPEHLYAHIIVNAFNTAQKQLRLEESVKSSPKNLIIEDKDGRLIYY